MAGVERIELPSAVLETVMLPLYHTPTTGYIYNLSYIYVFFNLILAIFLLIFAFA